ncbi:MAG: molybdenum cofactor biosynthesis F family protein [Oscillospiraceae bacterium]|nr:molybdenum cofactor biosynthesis F family protein [Oscillospiraceae bacterium]
MYRLDYTNLDMQQVNGIVASGGAPVCASQLCEDLAGKTLKIVTDKLPVEGPVLEYSFDSATQLTVKENGGAPAACAYGALSLKNMVLFSHMVPGTKRGYAVAYNAKTSVATVFEMWFIDDSVNIADAAGGELKAADVPGLQPFICREVQRQCYTGYVEIPGKAPPEQRDKLSLRLENSMILWKEDRGKKRLTTYTSNAFTTFVEIGTPESGDVLTFVSDLLQVNDTTYIHCFGEVEYSGRLSVEVLDISGVKKVGVTMGIDENDEFEYVMYRGKGKFLGRYASFSDFNDRGDQHSDFAKKRLDFSVKGARQSYRPSIMAKKISEQELRELAKDPIISDSDRILREYGENFPIPNVPADTDYCVGKKVAFRGDDGYCVEMEFKTMTQLAYRVGDDAEWHDEIYHPVEIDDDLIILGFYRTGSFPPAALFFAIDFNNGCATCLEFKIGTKYELTDVDTNYHFGCIKADGVAAQRIFRHGFTSELLGRAFTRTWNDNMTSMHIYNSPRSYSWTITNNGEPGTPAYRAGGYVWSSPCDYIKLRDNVYVMNWVQQKWDGLQGLFCMNLKTMHDSGFTLAVHTDGRFLYFKSQGCLSRPAGYIDLSGVYELTNYDTKA